MMSEAIALAGDPVSVQNVGALAVEVRCRLIGVQVVENRSEILAADETRDLALAGIQIRQKR